MKPLYIWAGGKNKMIPKYHLSPGIPMNGYDTFVEPFFGGGAMMIHVYQNNPTVKKFILNDINPEIVGIYTAIKTDIDNFLKRIDTLQAQYLQLSKDKRKEFYYDLRKQYTTNWKQWNQTEESATLYFLMKTGFNGIWQVNQESNGRFATPCGLLNQTTKVYDKDNVLEWNTFLQKVDIFCGDWSACTKNVVGKAFYFFDPPYRDSFTSYGQIFGDQQQLDCIQFCKDADKNSHYVMFCNRDSGDTFFTDNQGDLNIFYYDVTYTAGRRKQTKDAEGNVVANTAKSAKEILLASKTINCPKIPSPIIKKSKEKKILNPNLFIE